MVGLALAAVCAVARWLGLWAWAHCVEWLIGAHTDDVLPLPALTKVEGGYRPTWWKPERRFRIVARVWQVHPNLYYIRSQSQWRFFSVVTEVTFPNGKTHAVCEA
jgi:hypothetical protein